MTGSRGSNVLHCTAELMVGSAVHSADAERLGVLRNVLPGSELGTSLVSIVWIGSTNITVTQCAESSSNLLQNPSIN